MIIVLFSVKFALAFTFLHRAEAAVSFASVAPQLLELVNSESNIVPIVDQYIQAEEERLAKLKKLATKLMGESVMLAVCIIDIYFCAFPLFCYSFLLLLFALQAFYRYFCIIPLFSFFCFAAIF